MPLFWDDFIAGTISFGADEVGGYLLLLHHQWAHGYIEDDPKLIERISRCEYGKLRRVLDKFDPFDDDKLFNRRLDAIRTERMLYIQGQKEKSLLGVEARARKREEQESAQPEEQPTGKPDDSTAGKHSGITNGLTHGSTRRLTLPSPSPSPLPSPPPDYSVGGQSRPKTTRRRCPLNREYGSLKSSDIPAIEDYADIHDCWDPIIAAMAVTMEPPAKNSWKWWVKYLSRLRKSIGPDKADAWFRQCLCTVYGEYRQGEVDSLGATFNDKLKKRKGKRS